MFLIFHIYYFCPLSVPCYWPYVHGHCAFGWELMLDFTENCSYSLVVYMSTVFLHILHFTVHYCMWSMVPDCCTCMPRRLLSLTCIFIPFCNDIIFVVYLHMKHAICNITEFVLRYMTCFRRRHCSTFRAQYQSAKERVHISQYKFNIFIIICPDIRVTVHRIHGY